MRILLLDPGAAGAGAWTIGLLRMPVKMALLQLYSFLRHQQQQGEPTLADASFDICDLETLLPQPQDQGDFEGYLQGARQHLEGIPFDVVLLSCWSSLKYRLAVEVAQLCRQLNSQVLIVAGGWHPSARPQDFLYENTPFDHVVVGEGEWAVLDLLKSYQDGSASCSVPRARAQGIFRGRLLRPEEEVPLLWQDYPDACNVPTLPIFFSRGCPFTCNYCMEPYTKGQSWRALSVPRALKRVERMMGQTQAKYIDVHDPLFAAQKQWRHGFFEGLKALDFDRFMWTESRADIFHEEDLQQFAQFSFQMDFGVETASEEMLTIMDKTKNPRRFLKRTRETLLAGSKHNLTSQVYLITHHPGERLHHVKQTLAYFEGVIGEMSSSSLISISAQPYRYYPGTAVGRDPQGFYERFGTVIEEPEWWKMDGDMRSLSHATRDSFLTPQEQADIDECWTEGLGRLNQKLLQKRSDRAAKIIATRSAGFLDLALYQQRQKQ